MVADADIVNFVQVYAKVWAVAFLNYEQLVGQVEVVLYLIGVGKRKDNYKVVQRKAWPFQKSCLENKGPSHHLDELKLDNRFLRNGLCYPGTYRVRD